jgi:hypothetical protein
MTENVVINTDMSTTNNNDFQGVNKHQVKEVGINEAERKEKKRQAELYTCHNRLSHLSMYKLQEMASLGLLPSAIARCRIPICQSCIFGSMTKQAPRTKATPNTITDKSNRQGDHVLVDQLILPHPGLLGQLNGIPTKARYRVAIIFVDTHTRYTYINVQQTTNAIETLEAKKSFETHARSSRVNIKHYHADNGRFIERMWQNHAIFVGQTLSYTGVDAHNQNGIVEKESGIYRT